MKNISSIKAFNLAKNENCLTQEKKFRDSKAYLSPVETCAGSRNFAVYPVHTLATKDSEARPQSSQNTVRRPY